VEVNQKKKRVSVYQYFHLTEYLVKEIMIFILRVNSSTKLTLKNKATGWACLLHTSVDVTTEYEVSGKIMINTTK
jgi:hypothetical protein